MKLLVTGGAGFIGCNFIRYLIERHPDWEITNLDKLTYAGNLENLKEVEQHPHYRFIKGDIADRQLVDSLFEEKFDAVINFAAESHVDRSILDASPFLETNIRGTQVLLEGVRKYKVKKFIQVSTDEVYGSIEKGSFTELSPIHPSSPYSASKAAADLLCIAYYKTHGTPVIITRCSNNFGPYQFPEKFIPLAITNAIEDKPIPLYGNGLNIRDWIFVLDHCSALELALEKGRYGEIYNIGAGNEMTNLALLQQLLNLLGKPESLIKFVTDRPGHDHRYSLNTSKLRSELGWQPLYPFDKALAITVEWYLQNKRWWQRIKSGDYVKYYEQVYSKR